ncbi:MAG: LamG-like jellyroll fold domain-containing protein, partial [Planctomycetota bacterium]
MIDCLRGTPDAIDGDLSDWNHEAMTPAVLDTVEQLNSGQDSWDGPEDCGGEFYLLWDDVNIYIAAVVKDDKLSMNKSGADIWNSDCVEVLFSTTDARADHSWTNPTIHYQYGFNANNQKWNWCNMDGPGQSEPDYLQIAATETADGYILEASIEYGQMLSLDFSAGNTIGFHVCIDDTDIDNGDTEFQMTWTGLAAHDQSLGFEHMILSADPVPAPEPVNPGADGLVAHYAFENDANDSSGNALDGTIIGDAIFADSVDGMALDFDGIDDVVELGKIDVIGQITLAAWIKADDFEINDARIIAKANEWGGNDHWWMLSTISETSLRFRLKTDDGQETATLISEAVLEAGVWAHVAVTWDGGMMRIYKDGVEIASQEKGGSAVAVDPNISAAIGSQPSDAFASDPSHVAKFFDGLIDEVGIYERALSEGEILYLAGERPIPVNPGSDGLVAYYALENDANDNSGNGLDGTIIGEPAFVEGAVGMGLQLDGVDDYVDLGNDPIFDITGEVTLAAWVNVNDIGNGENDPWIGKGDTSYMLKGHRSNNEIEFFIYDGGWVTAHADVGESFNNTWHHAAGTFDGDQLIIYVDGEVGVSVDYEGVGIVPNTYNVAIGSNTQAGGRFSEGIHDEVMIYDRALSAGEIRYLAGFRENLVQNPSFEEDEAILDDPDWYQWVTWNPAEGAGSNATIVDTDSAEGARSLFVEPIGVENWHFIVLYMPIPTEVGASYTTTFWARAAEPRPLGAQYKATDNSVQWGYADFD